MISLIKASSRLRKTRALTISGTRPVLLDSTRCVCESRRLSAARASRWVMSHYAQLSSQGFKSECGMNDRKQAKIGGRLMIACLCVMLAGWATTGGATDERDPLEP